ncbi:RNA polymerase sigma factor, sigma-70 family [Mariniphaga anaerophila]|uniref:RNA polymerase sigma factor, sigma-70 family n=2 Tax=Mariniphaga anaerophila TaxID=1484053 RepID=A0A1M4YZG7_9BACT|nr:RNA polymerase sigma factor, sigma-70 family [Mariniphaga anaerophila]
MFNYGMKLKYDSDFVKDCIQEVFFQLIKKRDKLGQTDNIKLYLLKSVKNRIIRELSSKNKESLNKKKLPQFESVFSVEDEFIQKEGNTKKETALFQAITKLSERQREAIFLKYECDLSYSEICELMNISNDSARKLVYRAVTRIKQIIHKNTGPGFVLFLTSLRKYVL